MVIIGDEIHSSKRKNEMQLKLFLSKEMIDELACEAKKQNVPLQLYVEMLIRLGKKAEKMFEELPDHKK